MSALPFANEQTRRRFLHRLGGLGIGLSAFPLVRPCPGAEARQLPPVALTFPGPWQFLLPKHSIILVSDQQLEDLQDPDKEVDLSLSSTPNRTTLRKVCEQARTMGARTLILAFDEFWSQYRPGQGGKPRELLPDTEAYIQRLANISRTVKTFGLGFELSLLSPLEIGRGYRQKTGESGRWVQYAEGYRDPATGMFSVPLWEQRQWTNNKGTIQLTRAAVRVFAFREQRVGASRFYYVDPTALVELKSAPELLADQSAQSTTRARRLLVSGRGDTEVGGLDRVLVVLRYETPELDYFSPKALPFLRELVQQYHAAGVPLNGLYSDEMHIQQDWNYAGHHDQGEFTFRYLTTHFAESFATLYGAEFRDFEKYLVYFAYAQHGFLPTLEARLPAQHALADGRDGIQQTFLLRRRYFDLLQRGVVSLFVQAKEFAEKTYGHELEARAHATWAESPTCDFWDSDGLPEVQRKYEYTPDFLWSNTVHQAASACDDYFAWNDFLTGGGNDHAEGGWADRNYFGIALACSTGILNRKPYAYAAAWGMPYPVLRRHQAVCDAFGASASPWFQAVQDSQHRDTDVLMLYPMSLVACEERFGSWMVQYGYANYVTPQKLLERARVTADGRIEMAGRTFRALAVLFEPLPPQGLLEFLELFARRGGKLIWSGPPCHFDFAGQPVLEKWRQLFGVKQLRFANEGQHAAGSQVRFQDNLAGVPAQTILTDFLVDLVYPVEPAAETSVVAVIGEKIVGLHRALPGQGSATFLGFRPRDDQAASLGMESRTWFELLLALGAYPGTTAAAPSNDNPSVVSRTSPYVACSFPNGTTTVAAHYRSCLEIWPGGFHRDAKQDEEILAKHPLPSAAVQLRDFPVNGHRVSFDGQFTVAFRTDASGTLVAFAGHDCRQITVDGRDYVLASAPMPLLAWAPVLSERRVPGGAALEIWTQGEAELSLPLPAGVTAGSLYFEGARLDAFGERVPCECASGVLRFRNQAGWGQRQLFFVAS